jgi:hypothetical protein
MKRSHGHVLASGRARLCRSLIWQHANRTSMYHVRTRAFLLAFVLAALCWTKSLLCNVAAFTGMPFISETSDIQSLFLWYGKSLFITKFERHKLQEGYFSVQGRFCADSYLDNSDPKLLSRRCGIASGSSLVSNIRPEAYLSTHHSFGRWELSVRMPISV